MEIAVLLAIEASLFLIGVAVRLMLVVAQYGLAGMLRVLEAFFKRPLRTLLRIIQAVAVIGIILAATVVLVEHFAHHASFPAIWKELDAASIRPILRHQPINPDDAPEAWFFFSAAILSPIALVLSPIPLHFVKMLDCLLNIESQGEHDSGMYEKVWHDWDERQSLKALGYAHGGKKIDRDHAMADPLFGRAVTPKQFRQRMINPVLDEDTVAKSHLWPKDGATPVPTRLPAEAIREKVMLDLNDPDIRRWRGAADASAGTAESRPMASTADAEPASQEA